MNTISGYNKNDFFYMAAMSGNYMPKDDSCHDLKPSAANWNTKCSSTNFDNNNEQCIKKELCINKEYADKLLKYDQTHYGKDEMYLNTKMIYGDTYKTSISLVIGILGMGFFIYNNRAINYKPS